jgi:diacylglycerol kinase family enzyme
MLRRMRLALLANPESGRGQAPEAERLLRGHGAEVRRFALQERDEAVAWSPDRIAVAGGDGSIAAVAEAAGRAGLPIAVVPTGTANDFARAHGLPSELDEACGLAVNGDRTRQLELAWIGEHPFVNAASVGLAPAAARRADGLKRVLGPLAYSVGAVHAGLRTHPVTCRVSCDGDLLFGGAAWQVTVAATGAFGAGSNVDADPSDGRLDVVVIEASSRARLVLHAYGLRAGRLESQRGVRRARAGRVEVDAEAATFNVDGDLVEVSEARFRAQARAFAVVVG